MNYKDSLILITILFYPNNKFDCKALSKLLFIYHLYRFTTGQQLDLLDILKRTSNDLDRLYKMGFLSRSRVRRRVMTKRGTRRNSGFKYEYMVSKQGRDYFNYLLRRLGTTGSEREKEGSRKRPRAWLYSKDPVLEEFGRKYESNLGGWNLYAQDLFADYKGLLLSRGSRYNRFPAKFDRKLMLTCICCIARLDNKTIELVQEQVETYMATSDDEENPNESRILEALSDPRSDTRGVMGIIKALADRALRLMAGDQPNIRQPVSKKYPYVIQEVQDILLRQSMPR